MTRRRRRPTRLPYTALFRSAPVAAVAPAAAPEPATAPVQVEERAPWYRRAGPWLAADPRAGTTAPPLRPAPGGSEEHTPELQSLAQLVCRLLLEKKKRSTGG